MVSILLNNYASLLPIKILAGLALKFCYQHWCQYTVYVIDKLTLPRTSRTKFSLFERQN